MRYMGCSVWPGRVTRAIRTLAWAGGPKRTRPVPRCGTYYGVLGWSLAQQSFSFNPRRNHNGAVANIRAQKMVPLANDLDLVTSV
jgi:hypothetical protein